MKKTITLSLSLVSCLGIFAQLPVSTTPGKKQVVIEELTANLCGYCPGGHTSTANIMSANPGKVFSIRNHPNGFSLTQPSQSTSKDLRTDEAKEIYMIPGILAPGQTSIGLPCAAINRATPAGGVPPTYAGGRLIANGTNYWANMTNAILNENSHVNIAGQAYVHPTTRQMIVNIEAYFTSTSTLTNKCIVALTQNNIIGYQSSGSSTYNHKHILRDYISGGSNMGARGDAITPTTSGTKWTKTYTLTIPAEYGFTPGKNAPAVLADLEIIAYIATTSDGKDIVAACKVPITITTSTAIFEPANSTELLSNVNVYPNPMANEGVAVFTISKESNVTVEVVNTIGQVVKSDKLGALNVGEHKYELNTMDLTNGIYFVNINVDGNITSKKISVVK